MYMYICIYAQVYVRRSDNEGEDGVADPLLGAEEDVAMSGEATRKEGVPVQDEEE